MLYFINSISYVLVGTQQRKETYRTPIVFEKNGNRLEVSISVKKSWSRRSYHENANTR